MLIENNSVNPVFDFFNPQDDPRSKILTGIFQGHFDKVGSKDGVTLHSHFRGAEAPIITLTGEKWSACFHKGAWKVTGDAPVDMQLLMAQPARPQVQVLDLIS